MNRFKNTVVATTTLLLVACGGGSSSPANPGTTTGGSTTGGTTTGGSTTGGSTTGGSTTGGSTTGGSTTGGASLVADNQPADFGGNWISACEYFGVGEDANNTVDWYDVETLTINEGDITFTTYYYSGDDPECTTQLGQFDAIGTYVFPGGATAALNVIGNSFVGNATNVDMLITSVNNLGVDPFADEESIPIPAGGRQIKDTWLIKDGSLFFGIEGADFVEGTRPNTIDLFDGFMRM